MPDLYDSFAELAAAEEGAFHIECIDRGSPVAVMTVHGGLIEPRTAEIAAVLAGDEHSLYSFHGIKAGRNKTLHLRSERFDEERAVALAGASDVIISVHGCRDREGERCITYLGGRHRELRRAALEELHASGFAVLEAKASAHNHVRAHFRGLSWRNICNRSQSGRGLQLELTHALRRELMPWIDDGFKPQPRLGDYKAALDRALAEVLEA